MSPRDEARQVLHVYMSRTGLSLGQIADRAGYSAASLRQFSSQARYGDGNGDVTAAKLTAFFKDNPPPAPELPGKLYETEATREMDKLLAYIARGRWGTCYGPAGAQKTFLLEYRAAEAAVDSEPRIVHIRTSPSGMSPAVLLRRIAAGLAAPYAQYVDGIRQSVLYALRRRKTPVAIVLDEAQHLFKWVDTIETLRETGDLGGWRVGILLAGNEQVTQLFSPRRGQHFEQWRSRIQQKEIRVLGPSREEARKMIAGELGEVKEAVTEMILKGCMVADPLSKRQYVNARRLFNVLRDTNEARGKGNSKAH